MQDTATDIPAHFEEYRDALTDDDLPRAVEAAVLIEEVDADVTSMLTDFADAVNRGERDLAKVILDRISAVYADRQATEQARIERAMATIEQETLSNADREMLLSFTRNAAQTELNRTGFITEAVSYIENQEAADGSDVAETAERTKQSEADLADSEESASSTTADSEIAASPSILGTDAVGELAKDSSTVMATTVGNVGDAATGTLSLAVDPDEGLDAAPATHDLGSLDGNEQRRVETTVTGRQAGDHSVGLVLRSTDVSEPIEETSESFTVTDTPDTVREAITGTEDGTFDSADIRTAISYWAAGEAVPGTGGTTIDTARIQDLITEWLDDRESEQ